MRILTVSELEAVAGGLSITATSSLSVATSASTTVTTIAAGGASCAFASTSEAIAVRVRQLVDETLGAQSPLSGAQGHQLAQAIAKLQALEEKLP